MEDEAEVLDLPDEVWVAVFGLLEPIHTAAVTLTCRRWRAVFHSDPPLWRAFHDQLLGGPLVPALLTAPALPLNYPVHFTDSDATYRVVGRPFERDRLSRRLRQVEREAWFGADEWRAALEWKVRRVRKWGVSPEGRLEWAARLGCTRLVATLLRRYWRELSITARASTAVTKALRAAACANDVESVEPTRTSLGRGLEEALMGYAPMLEAARWGNHELIQLLHDHSLTGNSKSEAFPALLVASSLVKLYSLSSSTLGFGFGIRPALTPQQFVVMPDVEARSALFGPEFHKTLAPGELCNALWSAAKEGHNEVIEYLLDCGAEVTSPSPIEAYARLPSTALRPATLMRLITVSKSNEEMVEALLKCGADPRRLFGHSCSTDKAQRIDALLAAHRDAGDAASPRGVTSKRKRPSSPTPQAHQTDEPEAPTHQKPKKRAVDDQSC
ncbi:Fbox domain containing protein [Acanthamoeba castellanii str. Neff]|uniref:Fbox domain containing protein n=1 Tax=Acanthamoeba castellanii (strain ATCC 30010 / Neff) TaxID=1257118 RepID=L8GL05_ACACF|nr:Fbox domain containing protein [Acanthamoeba castellanii str. Neff]ELR13697.1 Fbox domain containing protein [Acanthamoeba castellanii str. Neff]